MTVAMTLAQDLLGCLETALLAGPNPPPANRIMLRAGDRVTPMLSTVDDECCSGLGWVRIARITGVKNVGELDNVSCFSQERTLELEMGVARCAPTPGPSSLTTEEQWETVALQLDADQGSMEAAVCCAFGEDSALVEEASVGEYLPFGPDGNCVGGTMSVFVRMTACC